MMEYNFSSFVAIMKYEICGFSAYKLTIFLLFRRISVYASWFYYEAVC